MSYYGLLTLFRVPNSQGQRTTKWGNPNLTIFGMLIMHQVVHSFKHIFLLFATG